ncbi:zf-HC2 domain-containing protein [Gorillibacterium sp. sgz5001074]|uniref:zf-HC2 domain-containing protein n=1 Tax=Gorillibacterium sp. sgz5001074 TaxID=3446695 RepID=UPI003F66B493
MECHDALPLMHEYLDGDLEAEDSAALKRHLIACPSCNRMFKQMEQADAMVRMLPKSPVPAGLTARIMAQIPEPKRRTRWYAWVKSHPALSVASVFLLVMISSFLSLLNEDQDMVVKGANLDQVVIRGDTVIIPEGHTVQGDLMVKRGKIQVDGNVEGDLTVVDGSYNLASTAYISGHVNKVDETLEWIWYRMNEVFSAFAK